MDNNQNNTNINPAINQTSTPTPPMPSPAPTAQSGPTPPPPPAPQMTPPVQPIKDGEGKGGALIVGGILFIFIVIVVALYFLIIRQSSPTDSQITPQPVQNTQPQATPTPAGGSEQEEVINVEVEENLDGEFQTIDEDLKQL